MSQILIQKYGEVLKRRRKVRGITLNELSARTRIGREDLEGVEQGRIQISAEDLERIEKFLRRQRII